MSDLDLDLAMSYVEFVKARHLVWERRQAGAPREEWTDDPVLQHHKFTNVFRVLDPGSQFPLRELYYGEDRPALVANPLEALFRAFAYRYTNRPEPWVRFHEVHGRYPYLGDVLNGELQRVWQELRAEGGKVFSVAYRVAASPHAVGIDKIEWALGLIAQHLDPGSPDYLGDRVLQAETPRDQIAALVSIHRCGYFLAQQIMTDLRYAGIGPHLDEDEYTPLGPGAVIGALTIHPHPEVRKLSQEYRLQNPRVRDHVESVLDWCMTALRADPDCPALILPDGRRRLPSYMDGQNTLCEFHKYVRYQGKPLPKKQYRPAHPGDQTPPMLPRHW